MKTKKLFLLPVAGFLLLQVFQINRKLPETDPLLSLEIQYTPPLQVVQLLKNACYDCHSKETRYPWYASIQPIGWWIQRHVRQGREALDFSEIGRWDPEEQADILQHCAKMIHSGMMPLSSYLNLHPEARLSSKQKAILTEWMQEQASKTGQKTAELTSLRTHAVVSDTCDDNDANPRCCFVQMPERVGAVLQLAPEGEPGPRIQINGQFFKSDGQTPYPNVLLYAYQTDRTGHYTKNGDETGVLRWHGRLHAWGRTDAQGSYTLQSIQPAAYPGRSSPAHIHIVVWEPEKGAEPHYIPDFLFADDPLLGSAERKDARLNSIRSNVVQLKPNQNGVLVGQRDIVLK